MYVFCFFREFGPALHLAISDDLFNWRELNDQEPILESNVGGKYWRDPFIIRAQDGIFHLLCTDGWGSQYIAHASSSDLLNWSEQELLHVMKEYAEAKNAWAPEAVFDPNTELYYLYWSSTVPDAFPSDLNKPSDYKNHRIYCCTTKDFVNYSPTKIFFDPGFNCIDLSIGYNGQIFLMAFKDERGDNSYFKDEIARKFILTAIARDLKKPWTIDFNPISGSTYDSNNENDKEFWAEGPCVFWNKHTKEWWIFYEYFRSNKYGSVKSSDGKNWEKLDKLLHFPEAVKHGTIFEINDPEIIKKLESNYVSIVE